MNAITVYVPEWTEEHFNDQSDHPELLNVTETGRALDNAIAAELEKLSNGQSVSVEQDDDRAGDVENGNKDIEMRLSRILRDDGIFHLDGWTGVYDEK
ncbi:MAG: hypothetical protein L0287_28660 [Anaerolineae bacterium]|nr:hypothetical protein [Anaerolineae bacterium]